MLCENGLFLAHLLLNFHLLNFSNHFITTRCLFARLRNRHGQTMIHIYYYHSMLISLIYTYVTLSWFILSLQVEFKSKLKIHRKSHHTYIIMFLPSLSTMTDYGSIFLHPFPTIKINNNKIRLYEFVVNSYFLIFVNNFHDRNDAA